MEKKIGPKFARETVGNVTGLEGIELNLFIDFCNFDPDFLLNASEYEIASAILVKLKTWKRNRNP